ncbi:hypothetical protein LWI28_011915 [Acer negundo]|uniref:Uncharacterized protein n=1 Tax=Acer negundo TaxID=4023 RepID=A0AAD5NZ16_ACENE|nr:hypothetical protein LWI28_011915 [Acer negundo]
MLRDKSDNHKFKKYFEQRAFSFGPYYQPYYTQNMAIQIKVILADDFLKQNGVKKEDLYEDIKKQIKELKDCYDDDLTKYYKDKDHELVWMFLVDGFAILQLMYTNVNFQANRDIQNWQIGE